jgi:hypothetical protein
VWHSIIEVSIDNVENILTKWVIDVCVNKVALEIIEVSIDKVANIFDKVIMDVHEDNVIPVVIERSNDKDMNIFGCISDSSTTIKLSDALSEDALVGNRQFESLRNLKVCGEDSVTPGIIVLLLVS